jgi:hypothetical protein
MLTTRLLFVSSLVAAAATAAQPARAQRAMCIRIPEGMGHGLVTTQPSAQAGMQYVVISNVVIVSPVHNIGSYRVNDFSLIVGDNRYHPVARPGLGAIDISQGGVVGPRDRIKGNLAFLVPESVNAGSVEFRPANWESSTGPVIYCCASSCA